MFCFLSNLRFQEAIENFFSDVSLGHRLKFVYCGFSSLGCSWPAACLDTSPTTSMRWSNSHLPQVCLLWGSYHNSKSYRLFWGGFVTVFLLLFAGHWWAGPGANWVGILIFLSLCFLSCNFRDGRHSPLFLLFNLTNAQGNHVCGASKRENTRNLVWPKIKHFTGHLLFWE